jgi:SAM-dependent methyltransferase
MSDADMDKWNQRYREGAYRERMHASALLRDWLPRLTVSSSTTPQAADIGCGAGRNSLHLARHGWSVTAFDISQVALDRLAAAAAQAQLPIVCIQADLESPSALPAALRVDRHYDLVMVMRYTNLPLIGDLQPTLKTGGYLMVELHLQTEAEVVGPRNPKFRLAPGALRRAAADLEIFDYREGLVEEPDGRVAALAQLIARRN